MGIHIDFGVLDGADPYAVLGVRPDADDEEIRAARRARQLSVHPDRRGDSEQSKLVNVASEILLNPDLRRRYDQTRQLGEHVVDPGGWAAATPGFSPPAPVQPVYREGERPGPGPGLPHGAAPPIVPVPPMPPPYGSTPSTQTISMPLIVGLAVLSIVMICGVVFCLFSLVAAGQTR